MEGNAALPSIIRSGPLSKNNMNASLFLNNRLPKLAAAILLGCGLTSPGYSDYFNLKWSSQNSSWLYMTLDIPSACTVTINAWVYAPGGTYSEGPPDYTADYIELPGGMWVPYSSDLPGTVHTTEWDGAYTYSGTSYADGWINVYMPSGGYNRVEYRSDSNPSESSIYGSSVAGTYAIDCEAETGGSGQVNADIEFDW
jgi:hypothetical protein